MTRFHVTGERRIGWTAFVGLLLLIAIATLLWRARSPSEPPDTAPLNLRGKPINPAATSPAAPALGQGGGAVPNAVAGSNPPASKTADGLVSGSSLPTPSGQTLSGTTSADTTGGVPIDADGFRVVSFDRLAGFEYDMPPQPLPAGAGPETLVGRIPDTVRALDQKQVAVKGFMLPLKLESGLAIELLLMRDQSMCCFGVVPKINEWVNVRMSPKGVKPVMDQPVTIYGRLRVGEVIENGYVVCLYSLDGERLATALDE